MAWNDVYYGAKAYSVLEESTNDLLVTFGSNNNANIVDPHILVMDRVLPLLLITYLSHIKIKWKFSMAHLTSESSV